MLPIYAMWDSGVSMFEANCIQDALMEFKETFPERRIVIYGSKQWCAGDHSSADWYIRETKALQQHFNGLQLSADILLDLIQEEPWQKTEPHVDLLVTSYNLTAKGFSYCYGVTYDRFVVLSISRYGRLSFKDAKLAIKAAIWHELGHVFGLASHVRRSDNEYKLGTHCTNSGCSMYRDINFDEWVSNAKIVDSMHRIYCSECKREMSLSKI